MGANEEVLPFYQVRKGKHTVVSKLSEALWGS